MGNENENIIDFLVYVPTAVRKGFRDTPSIPYPFPPRILDGGGRLSDDFLWPPGSLVAALLSPTGLTDQCPQKGTGIPFPLACRSMSRSGFLRRSDNEDRAPPAVPWDSAGFSVEAIRCGWCLSWKVR